jgi:hypothetical protein
LHHSSNSRSALRAHSAAASSGHAKRIGVRLRSRHEAGTDDVRDDRVDRAAGDRRVAHEIARAVTQIREVRQQIGVRRRRRASFSTPTFAAASAIRR